MLRGLAIIFKERLNAIQKLTKMAENLETVVLGEKRTAVSPPKQEVKKKKKHHVVTLGKDEGCKRKVALLVAYNGAGYFGVQVNRGFQTIESELMPAMVKAGTVPQEHVDNMSKMWFQRGSRTDKGVSAVGQIFSLKMVIVPDLVAKLNENLPEKIRVLGYVRTTNGFDSKNFCCGRTYMYMTPTFAFAPLEKFITDEYRITDDRIEQVRDILKKYVGTHKFHNFTSGVKYEQANASRYIISFECSEPYVREGIEFVTIRVKGQSFMLHQIRKMIGLTIAILRGYCTEVALTKSWAADRIDVPKAPGLGLVLESLHFDGYNKKFGSDGVHNPIDWSAQKDTMDDFKEKYIISHIVEQEKKERIMLNWLQTLQFHNFDVTRPEGPQKPWVKTEKLLQASAQNPASPNANENAACSESVKDDAVLLECGKKADSEESAENPTSENSTINAACSESARAEAVSSECAKKADLEENVSESACPSIKEVAASDTCVKGEGDGNKSDGILPQSPNVEIGDKKKIESPDSLNDQCSADKNDEIMHGDTGHVK